MKYSLIKPKLTFTLAFLSLLSLNILLNTAFSVNSYANETSSSAERLDQQSEESVQTGKNLMELNGISTEEFKQRVLQSFNTSEALIYQRVAKVVNYPEFIDYVQELYLSFFTNYSEAKQKSNLKNKKSNPDLVVEGHIRSLTFSLEKSILIKLNDEQKEILRINLLPVFQPKAQKEFLLNQCKYFLN